MKGFKAGDKVRRIAGEHEGMVVGDIAVVTHLDSVGIRLEGFEYQHDPENFELVKNEKEIISKWLKENAWYMYIKPNNPAGSKAVQKWLFEHGVEWWNWKYVHLTGKMCLTNVDTDGEIGIYLMQTDNREGVHYSAHEVKIEFETIVKSVTLPSVPMKSEQEIKIEEIEAIISKAYEQIKQLKGEK